MSIINKTHLGISQIKKLAAFFRYSQKENILFAISLFLFFIGKWLISSPSILDPFRAFLPLAAYVLFGIGGILVAWVLYRFMFKIALSKPPPESKPLSHAIKGLMAFTQEDGELFRRLERENYIAQLHSYANDKKVSLLVIMGESGSGKTSLFRAGLSHALHGSEIKYIYWEAMPAAPVNSLLQTINDCLNVHLTSLDDLHKVNEKAVVVLDQFEQLLPERTEHKPVFDFLKQIASGSLHNKITWIVAFRYEYLHVWRNFEIDNKLKAAETMSLKLFSAAQAKNVFITLAEEAGLTLEQALVDGFTESVSRNERVSPVDIGIGLLMVNELANRKQNRQLTLEDYHFAGGSQGLFVSFMNTKIEERFSDKKEQETLFKALLELIDLNRNQRVAEGKTLEELTANAQGILVKHLEYALDYFASDQVRMLEKVICHGKAACYRLPHESMIPAIRQLGNKILDKAAQADLKLQTAWYAWQSSNKDSRYLLTRRDLKAVLQFKEQCNLNDKEDFLKLSIRRKNKIQFAVYFLTLFLSVSSFFTYQYVVESSYSNSLRDWGLPEDLRDYSQQLKVLTVADNDIRHLDWLDTFTNLTTLNLDLSSSNITDISMLKELKELKNLISLNLNLSSSNITDISVWNWLPT